jgi:hypothetical protein
MTERGQQAACVELHPLVFLEATRAGQEGLEAIGVLLDGPRAATLGELEQWCRAQGWTKPQVEEVPEAAPGRRALIFLQLDEPQLGDVLEVV